MRNSEKQGIADDDRVGELDQSIRPPRQEADVGCAENGEQEQRQDAEQADEARLGNLLSAPPQQDNSGNTGGGGRKRYAGRNLDGVVAVEPQHEQENQRNIEPSYDLALPLGRLPGQSTRGFGKRHDRPSPAEFER